MYFQFFFYQNWSRCTHTTSRATTFKVRLELILILQVRTAILKKSWHQYTNPSQYIHVITTIYCVSCFNNVQWDRIPGTCLWTWHYTLMTSDRSFPSRVYVIVAIMSTGVFYLMCLKIIQIHLYLLLTKNSLADLGS